MNLRDEAFAARSLLAVLAEDLREDQGDFPELDEETIDSVIASETGFDEALARTLKANAEDAGHIKTLETMIASMQARKARKTTRIERREGAILAALEIAGLRRRELPAATVSVTKGRRKVIITDKKLIPPQFMRTYPTPEPEADKDKILKARQAGEVVPGAELSNAMPTLRVMTK